MFELEAAAVLAGIAVCIIAYLVIFNCFEWFMGWRQAMEQQFSKDFRAVYVEALTPAGAANLFCGGLILVPLFSLVYLQSITSAVAGALFIYFTPRTVISYLVTQRLALFDEQLPAALEQIGRSISAGLSLAQAIEEASENAPFPTNEEFGLIAADHRLGSSLSDSIKNAADRLESKQFGLVSTALLVNIEKGGDLKKALHTISESMKEIWRLEQKLITASSEGRKAMMVISIVPLFVLLLVAFMQPMLIETLTGAWAGIAILLAAGLLYTLGLFWLRRILATEV
jgi:tight adherence protein B